MEVRKLTDKLLKEAGRRVYTITNDNGGDFKRKSNLKHPIYFCDPMKPQQRGTVENTIGLLRQYIKRKIDISKMTKKDFLELEKKINLRPRKVLGYKTPF
jgi:IS30 family transposase